MKRSKLKLLTLLTLLAGVTGSALMKLLYTTGIDHKGLLLHTHPAFPGIWILTALVGILLALGCRKITPATGWEAAFPRSVAGGLLCVPAAIAFAATRVHTLFGAAGTLDLMAATAGLLCCPALLYVCLCRIRGTKPHYLAFCVLCVCFALGLVGQYRSWSSDPQLTDYVFYLLAHVCLMLSGYQLAQCSAGGSCRALPFPALMGIYLGLVSLSVCPDPLFMLACVLWALSALPREEE